VGGKDEDVYVQETKGKMERSQRMSTMDLDRSMSEKED
jgi:hypothetical protein